ncbi:MAG: GGDEF domain-containing protein [Faecalibacillus faecis]
MDDFDEINGRFGLKCGDEILKQFSMCMQSCINENQKIYELGNGRFIIMDLANHSKEDILELYDELKKSVEVALEENVYRVVYTISVGIVEIDKEMKDYDTLIKYSDFALNEAKKKERIVVISLHKININNSFEEEKFVLNYKMQLIQF